MTQLEKFKRNYQKALKLVDKKRIQLQELELKMWKAEDKLEKHRQKLYAKRGPISVDRSIDY